MARAMGLNTIATYVFWNVHEPTPRRLRLHRQQRPRRLHQGRPGRRPLRHPPLRPLLLRRVGPRRLPRMAPRRPQIRRRPPLQRPRLHGPRRTLDHPPRPGGRCRCKSGRGGPILMTQIENEYGQYALPADDPHAYMRAPARHLREARLHRLLPLHRRQLAPHPRRLDARPLRRRSTSASRTTRAAWTPSPSARPGQALFVSEYWPGWFDHWGHPHETRPIAPQLEDIDYILTRGTGINIYMFQGGTSFGFIRRLQLHQRQVPPRRHQLRLRRPTRRVRPPYPQVLRLPQAPRQIQPLRQRVLPPTSPHRSPAHHHPHHPIHGRRSALGQLTQTNRQRSASTNGTLRPELRLHPLPNSAPCRRSRRSHRQRHPRLRHRLPQQQIRRHT